MKKNVASQAIGAQLVSATDGSAFTGSVTVYVTGDAGTQAAGSVGSGACTHEGNGYHTYAPAQAETNYDLIAFTFTGTGAVPATVQVFTSFPQTVDNATNISAIKTKTDNLPAAPASTTNITAATGVVLSGVTHTGAVIPTVSTLTGHTAQTGDTYALANGANGFVATKADTAAILVDTAEIGAAGAGLTNIGTIATVTNLTNLPAITANWLTAAGTAADFGAEVADAVWDEAIAGHLGAGSTGLALNSAGSAGDPWSTALPGAYGAGTAGEILGDWKNAGRLDAILDVIAADVVNVDGYNLATQIGTAGAGLTGTALATAAALVTAQADLDDIQTRLPAALSSGNMKVDVLALNGDATSAANIAKTTRAIARVTASGTPTTTSIPTSAITPSVTVADQLKGRILTFDADTTTAALRGQATDITANTSGGVLTVTALTTAPVSGDTGSVT